MKKITLYLPEDLHQALRAVAVRARKTQAGLAREALEAYLRQQAPPRPRSLGLGSDFKLAARNHEAWLAHDWGGKRD